MKSRAFAITLMLAIFPCFVARADLATRTRYWDEKARQAYQQGKFELALGHFLSVYEQTPSASAAYNVTLAAQQAKRRDLEYAFLQEYLSHSDEDRGRASRVVARLEQLKRNLALVTIESEPAGARIILDRHELGDYGVTPRTVVTQPSEHVVHLELDGYHPGTLTVSTEKGKEQKVKLALEPRIGKLQLEVQPVEAQVIIERNGQTVKTARASDLVDLPTGSYLIRLQAEGYQSQESRVLITEQKTERVVLVASRLPPKLGRLLVSADHREAQVVIDGKTVGATPLSTQGAVGIHTLEVQTTGCRKWSGQLVVQEGQTVYVNAHLDCGRAP